MSIYNDNTVITILSEYSSLQTNGLFYGHFIAIITEEYGLFYFKVNFLRETNRFDSIFFDLYCVLFYELMKQKKID